MTALDAREMDEVVGGGFLSGLSCGLGLTASFVAVVSPDPFSKLAVLTYGATLFGCVAAF